MLIEHGAEIDSLREFSGFTPLMTAAEIGHQAIVEFLIKKGANLNIKSQNGQSALELAKEHGKVDASQNISEFDGIFLMSLCSHHFCIFKAMPIL